LKRGKKSEILTSIIFNLPGWKTSPVSMIDRNPGSGFVRKEKRRR
jgi:hypothetical protein